MGADIEVPNTAVDMNLAVSACYPPEYLYPLSDGPSIQNHRITMTCFRTCSNCHFAVKRAYAIVPIHTMSNRV